MRHPFGGIIRPDRPSRRSWLRRAFATVAGLFGVGAVSAAAAAPPQIGRKNTRPTTLAVGEEGGKPVTTLAIGEEGGNKPTTLRVGEEGGTTTRTKGEEGGITTFALGEEGGGNPTTLRVGEEGGGPVTTLALGEEGGKSPAE